MLSFADIKTAASGRWPEILVALGIPASALKDKHGPCPGCGGRDRFRFDDQQRDGSFICGGGGSNVLSGDGFALIQHVRGCDVKEAFRLVDEYLSAGVRSSVIAPLPTNQSKTQRYALELWSQASGDPLTHPYVQSKQIVIDKGVARHTNVTGAVVGQHADCLLIPFIDFSTGQVQGVQVINAEGKKQTFGVLKGHGFVVGDTANRSCRWFVVEGWADAVSLVHSAYQGEAVAFVAFGMNMMRPLAERIQSIYSPEQPICIVEDAT